MAGQFVYPAYTVYRFWVKRSFSKKKKNVSNNDLGRHTFFLNKIVTLETGDMPQKVLFGPFEAGD
jgi:hypothetical protein